MFDSRYVPAKNDRHDKRLCLFVSLVVLTVFLTNLSHGLSSIFGYDSEKVTLFLKALIGINWLLVLNIIIVRLTLKLFVFVFVSILFAIANYVLFPHLDTFLIETYISFFSFCLPPFMCLYVLNNYEYLRLMLTKVSYIIASLMFCVMLGIFAGVFQSFNDNHYSMGLGYSCLIPTIMLVLDAVEERKFAWFGVCVLVLSIIVLGSRGPLVGIILFCSYMSLRNLVKKKNFLGSAALIFCLICVFCFYRPFLGAMEVFLSDRDMQVRVISTLLEKEVHMSGREELYDQIYSFVKAHPFEIRGVNAEWNVIGGYAHNFVIELIFQFGVVFGGIAAFSILALAIRTALLKDLNTQKILCVSFMLSSVSQLCFSSSLWQNYVFWMWLSVSARVFAKNSET